MITKVELKDNPIRTINQARQDIDDFYNSGWEICEVDYSHYSNIGSAYPCYHKIAKEYEGIIVRRISGHLYLLRK